MVTGASTGMGEQFARILAGRGFKLLITARDKNRLRELAAELDAAHGNEVQYLAADLAAEGVVNELLDWARDKDIGLLVSNAGFGLKGPHHEQQAAQLGAMLQVNCQAPTLLTHGLLPQLRSRPKAGVIMTGSIEGFVAFPWSAAYAASKAYVRSLGEALAWECRGTGVDIQVLAPGSTDTPALSKQGFDASRMNGVMSPREVVTQALANLGRKTVFVPGGGNKLFGWLLSNLPRKAAVNFAGSAMRKAVMDTRR
jgi:short-subunit dehydrogenase